MCALKRINLPLWAEIFTAFSIGISLAYYQLGFFLYAGLALIWLIYTIKGRPVRGLLTLTLVLLGGFLWFELNKTYFPPSLPAEIDDFKVKGRVVSYPRCDGKKCSFVLKTERKEMPWQKIQVFTYFDPSLERGDEILIKGKLVLPDKPGNPGEFDYASFLQKEKICYMLITGEEKNCQVVKRAGGIDKVLNSCRKKADFIIKDNLPPKTAGILLGMLLGQKEEIAPEDYRDFQKSGLVHVFAVSGLHVGFLAALAGFILSLFRISPLSKMLISCGILFLYGSITGWPVSVIRAVIMASLAMAAVYFKRTNQLLNSLSLAGFLILLLDPYALFKIGFQLSFAATFGLVYIYPSLRKAVEKRNWGIDLVLVPLAAQLAVLPLIAYYFYIFTPGAIIANILASYLAGGAIILGFLGVFVSLFLPAVSSLFIYPAGFLIEIIKIIVEMVVKLPGSYLWVKMPQVGLIIIYYTGVLLICYAARAKSRRWGYRGGLLIAVFVFILCLPPGFYNRGKLEITFIDVGQGDSILIKTPQGKFILLDGGGSRWTDVEGRKLLPYLHSRGINSFYMLVNSHPDTDHLKGLEAVAREHKTAFLWLPRPLSEVSEYKNLKSMVSSRGGRLFYLEKGQKVVLEKKLYIEVLYPKDEYKGGNYNNYSLVLYLHYGRFSALFPGDAEKEELQNMVKAGLKKAWVVKVPHHGSLGSLSSDFYEQVGPRLAVISVGKNNFGHPHPEVVRFLQADKIDVLRTDERGTITLLSDGSTLRIKTFKP